MSIDCTIYSDKDCLKANTVTISNQIGEIIVLACWGVYGDEGQLVVHKKKKGNVEKTPVIRGQQSVFNHIYHYSLQHHVSDLFFAGDNIYHKAFLQDVNPSDNEIGFKIDEQLASFEKCYEPIKNNVDRTFIGIGNHDLKDCEIMNKELNYFNDYNKRYNSKWQETGTYFRVLYENKDERGITVVMLDTNMYEEDQTTCNGEPYTDEDRLAQYHFISECYAEAIKNHHWIIFMGHIPAKANGHKQKRKVVFNEQLYNLLSKFTPHLYICGDEHNQQFIYDKEIGTSLAIVGSGGTDLDPIYYKQEGEEPIEQTLYAESMFGYLTINITNDHLSVTIISVEPSPSTNYRSFRVTIKDDRSIHDVEKLEHNKH